MLVVFLELEIEVPRRVGVVAGVSMRVANLQNPGDILSTGLLFSMMNLHSRFDLGDADGVVEFAYASSVTRDCVTLSRFHVGPVAGALL